MKLRSSLYGFAALLVSLAGAGCYNPTFENGTLQCSLKDGCPSGYMCNSSGTCDKVGSPGTGGSGGAGGGGGQTDAGVPMCFADFFKALSCQPKVEVGACDPVCQSGCGCRERCTVAGSTTICRDFRPTGERGVYESCQLNNDTCRPGSICLAEARKECGAHCYRFCRTDADCGSKARCTGGVEFENVPNVRQKVCSSAIEDCKPWETGRGCGGRGPEFGCYILSALYPDLTTCECAGTFKEGDECTYEHDCQPGFECLEVASVKVCRRLCPLQGGSPSCPGGKSCVPITPGGGARAQKVGYCG